MAWLYSDAWQGSNYEFMTNNALQVHNYLNNAGWSNNAIAAVLGNLQRESAINPHQKEFTTHTWSLSNDGYGIAGWTPGIKIKNYAEPLGLDYKKGNTQLHYLSSYAAGWGNSGDPGAPSVAPSITWEQFKVSNIAVVTLTDYFMWYWEKPTYDVEKQGKAERESNAAYWYQVITGHTPTPPDPDPPTPPKPFNIYYYLLELAKKRR